MKKKYQNFQFEDFAKDDSFRNWILGDEDRDFWENYLKENPEQQNDILLAKTFLENLRGVENKVSDEELDDITQNIINNRKSRKLTILKPSFYRIAAAVVAFIGISMAIYFFGLKGLNHEVISFGDSGSKLIETINSSDKIQDILLSDGSTIQLYPNSSIKYPNPFEPTKRVVYLDGQAFFDIAKNPEKPFWVHTDKLSTQVLGTSFLVNSYANQKEANVQVKTGKVSVYLQKDLKVLKENENTHLAGIILTPNQQASYSDKESHLVKSIVEAPALLVTPKKSEFIFEDTPLKDVLSALSKSYGITFTYNEKVIENCYLTANLEIESLYEKLNLICRITNSTYEVVDAQIIIYSRGCN
ncbi:MAG: FecR family protein [Spirosomaceae bacterium]|jgi:ferric-dicitrate binding protein FerR (iron transport regulator)|nr:FecR family protein [Spirosomataceae bacterium]